MAECPNCNTEFNGHPNRIYCSRTCQYRIGNLRRTGALKKADKTVIICLECQIECVKITNSKFCSKECGTKWNNKDCNRDPRKTLLYSLRHRLRYGKPAKILLHEIEWPTHCPILGVELRYKATGGVAAPNSASIDRKDSSRGYALDNVWIISTKANTIKSNATKEELLKFAEWVFKEYG